MRHRLLFILATAFFILMNALLWRSEFAQKSSFGTPVPAEVVWDKLVTSPDNSWLEIRHRGSKVGRAHWVATINEEAPEEDLLFEDIPPEGMVRTVTGYTLDFDGTVNIDEWTRLRFNMTLKLDTNQVWRDLTVKFALKPFTMEILASAAKQELRIATEDETRREYIYPFADLKNPQKILRDLGGPLLPAALGALAVPLPANTPNRPTAGISWEARNDRLRIGRTDLRVYRLETRLLGRYSVVLFVSPVGEVLRVELPDEIVLANDALTSL